MRILAVDLGNFKTVADYEAETDAIGFVTALTRPQALHDLIVDWTVRRTATLGLTRRRKSKHPSPDHSS